jgi:phosphoribosylformimino-5-aminoimidazole carboxamide ribonucleotide (ProFAR) isomerase
MASTTMMKNKRKVVEEPIKEHGIWILVDIECRVDKKVTLTWNSLFQAF